MPAIINPKDKQTIPNTQTQKNKIIMLSSRPGHINPGRCFHVMGALPHFVKNLPNSDVIHKTITHGLFTLRRESDQMKMNAQYESEVHSNMDSTVPNGIQGVHAPNPSVHLLDSFTHQDVQLLHVLDDVVSRAIQMRDSVLQQHQGNAAECLEGSSVVNCFLLEYMDQSCYLLSLQAHEVRVGGDEYELPNLQVCSMLELSEWTQRMFLWIGDRYSDYASMDGINIMGMQFLNVGERRDFSARICSRSALMRTILDGMWLDLQADLAQAEVQNPMRRSVVAVFDTLIQLFVDCTNRLVMYYTPFIKKNGVAYMKTILKRTSPFLAMEGLDYYMQERSYVSEEGGVRDNSSQSSTPDQFQQQQTVPPPSALASSKDIEEVFKFSSERLVSLLSSSNDERIISEERLVCKGIFKGFVNIFFVHWMFKMMSSSSMHTLNFLSRKIAPLDKQDVQLLNRGMRNAAVAMVALKEGNRRIEKFAGDMRASLREGTRDADQQASYYECTCKAAFLDFVMWQLNCWTFGKSPFLAQVCESRLLRAAGLRMGQELIDLMKMGKFQMLRVRTRVCVVLSQSLFHTHTHTLLTPTLCRS